MQAQLGLFRTGTRGIWGLVGESARTPCSGDLEIDAENLAQDAGIGASKAQPS